MTKIAFIGAGSFGFTRNLVRDILSFPALADATIALMDIDPDRLAAIKKAVDRIVAAGSYPAKVFATQDRIEALRGADGVVCTILAGGVQVWRHDIEIPKKYGVDINVGDTRGPAGIFRALRTIPVMLDICRDIERYCPQAIFLNYTNPMAMLCRAMQGTSNVQVTGLCHSVQGTAEMLAKWIGAPMDEVTYLCAGINHQAWYLDFRWKGQDAYPLIREAAGDLPAGADPQRIVPAPGLLCDRVQRPQLRVLRMVPQAPRPDRKVLHAWHQLESRRLRLYPE
jgi:alpha-galactosidase